MFPHSPPPSSSIPIFDSAARDCLVQGVFAAGEQIMQHFRQPLTIVRKPDHSPVTIADIAANQVIVAMLEKLAPEWPIISEEGLTPPMAPAGTAPCFWLVDPLDGTQNFIQQSESFCVNLALIVGEVPMLGIMLHPPTHTLYATFGDGVLWHYACPNHEANYGDPHLDDAPVPRIFPPPQTRARVALISHSRTQADHGQALPEEARHIPRISVASALKFFYLLEGKASHYPRMGPIMEWDIAAGDALLRAQGGGIWQLDGVRMTYRKPDYVTPNFIALAQKI